MKDKKKLLRITTVPVSLHLLISGQMGFMQSNGLEVVAVSANGPEVDAILQNEGVRHEVIPFTRKFTPFYDLYCLFLLVRLIRREQPDVVHTHTPKAGLLGMLAAWLCRVPKRMHTVAGMPLMSSTGFTKKTLIFAEWLTYKCAHMVLPNSIALRDFIFRHIAVDREKVMVIGNGSSNGIDTGHFNSSNELQDLATQNRTSLDIPANSFIWLFIGRLVGDKGIHELVESFVNLQNSHKDHYLVLVGAFENEKDAVKRSTKSVINDHPNIHSVGFQQDVRPWLQMATAFVFPSYREGFPNVVLQAQSMGLPCIVSDINGCNEIVVQGHNGIIVPPMDAKALEEAMMQYIENPGLIERNSTKTRKSVLEKYDRMKIWNTLLEEYSK